MCQFTELTTEGNSKETVGTLLEGPKKENKLTQSRQKFWKGINKVAQGRNPRNSLSTLCRRFLMVLMSSSVCENMHLLLTSFITPSQT